MAPSRILRQGVPVLLGVCVMVIIAAWCPEAQAVCQTSPLLPPGNGEYLGQFHAEYPQQVLLEDVRHKNFVDIVRTPDGSGERETFNSTLTAYVTYQGMPIGYQTLTGPVTVKVSDYTSGQTGTFSAEILSMNMTGNIGGYPVMIRESPSLPSTGQTTITGGGGGGGCGYDIQSFFDVYTELSVAGGPFMADPLPRPMTLVPEPATLALLALGGLALMRRRR